jgi:hypothetical protein
MCVNAVDSAIDPLGLAGVYAALVLMPWKVMTPPPKPPELAAQEQARYDRLCAEVQARQHKALGDMVAWWSWPLLVWSLPVEAMVPVPGFSLGTGQ